MTPSPLPPGPPAEEPLALLQGDVGSPHWGCLDIPQYEGEASICPHCAAVLAEAPADPPSWLAQWPATRRSGRANLFYAAVRNGATNPATIVGHRQAALYRKLQCTTDHDQRMRAGQLLNMTADDPV